MNGDWLGGDGGEREALQVARVLADHLHTESKQTA